MAPPTRHLTIPGSAGNTSCPVGRALAMMPWCEMIQLTSVAAGMADLGCPSPQVYSYLPVSRLQMSCIDLQLASHLSSCGPFKLKRTTWGRGVARGWRSNWLLLCRPFQENKVWGMLGVSSMTHISCFDHHVERNEETAFFFVPMRFVTVCSTCRMGRCYKISPVFVVFLPRFFTQLQEIENYYPAFSQAS